MVYKSCIVPQCTNNTKKSPQKLFVSVPTNPDKRKMWLQSARRNLNSISPKSIVFMCEDHFNMEKDTINYLKYKMGFSTKILLADKAVPTKFHCQEDGKKQLSGSSREVFHKRQRNHIVTECLQSQSTTDMHVERLQNDDSIKQEIFEPRVPEPVAEDEVPTVCRACLASGVRMVDVAAGGLQDMFERVTGTELHTADERPTQVCSVCCSQLQRFRAFSLMSRKAETYMTKLLKKGLQITEQAVSKHHRLIKPKLNVKKIPLIAIHTQEDPVECDTAEVKVEVEGKNKSDTEIESDNEITSEVKTGTNMNERDPQRENETEERQLDWETEGEIKIEIDEIDIEESDPFEAVEHTIVKDETCYCIQCAEAFSSQSELLKHIQTHTRKKLKQSNITRQKVNVKRTKRDAKTKVESQCALCNKTFTIKTQLVTHVATEHGFGEFSRAQQPKRRKPNILKKSK